MSEFYLKFELNNDIYFDLNDLGIEVNITREGKETGWREIKFEYVENYELRAKLIFDDYIPIEGK